MAPVQPVWTAVCLQSSACLLHTSVSHSVLVLAGQAARTQQHGFDCPEEESVRVTGQNTKRVSAFRGGSLSLRSHTTCACYVFHWYCSIGTVPLVLFHWYYSVGTVPLVLFHWYVFRWYCSVGTVPLVLFCWCVVHFLRKARLDGMTQGDKSPSKNIFSPEA